MMKNESGATFVVGLIDRPSRYEEVNLCFAGRVESGPGQGLKLVMKGWSLVRGTLVGGAKSW